LVVRIGNFEQEFSELQKEEIQRSNLLALFFL